MTTTMAREGPETARLVKRIGRAGFPLQFVRRHLPDWWVPEAELEVGALTELKIILARRLGLDLGSVLEDGPIAFALPKAGKFKRTLRVAGEAPPNPFLGYCTAVAQVVAAAMPQGSRLPSDTAEAERNRILTDDNVKWVSLNALLRRCWAELGIAVIQIADAPASTKGFDAASLRINGRAVIVLAKQASHPAWASFWLAHEIGHLGLGHVAEGSAVFDESEEGDTEDREEVAADSYGLTLLGGADLIDVRVAGKPNSASLAKTALSVGTSRRIDPGHLILRYARAAGDWEIAQAALSHLSPNENVSALINGIAARFLDSDGLGEDSRAALAAALAP